MMKRMMRIPRPQSGGQLFIGLVLVGLCQITLCGMALSAEMVDAEYAYLTQPRDTLIGLSRRLLKEPHRWRELQKRNGFTDPTHIPIGSIVRIPREWLLQHAESASVINVVGAARGNGAAIKANDVLSEGAVIETAPGGYVTIKIADGSEVVVNEASAVELKRMQRYETGVRDTQLKLERGSVATKIEPQGGAGRFEIRTPVAISAVRGTEFRRAFDVLTSRDRTEVTGGVVAVGAATNVAASSASPIDVPAGFGTISDATNGPRVPVKLLSPPNLAQLPERFVEDDVQFDFSPVVAAQAYRAQIASDAEFHGILAEQVTATASMSFAEVPDGHYWLRVRSVDGDGLEGADAVHEFERYKLLPPPQATAPGINSILTAEGAEYRWMAVAGAASYRLQLARGSDFREPIVERSDLSGNVLHLEKVTPGTYYWRIAAVDATGAIGRWGEPQRYVQKPLPAPLSQPIVTPTSVEVAWSGEPGQRFLVQVAVDPAFTRIVDEQRFDRPYASLSRYHSDTYYVRVQTTDADGYVGPFTSARQFVVPLPWWIKAAPFLLALPLL